MSPKVRKISFLLIVTLAFILRFFRLGEVPLSLDWDENSNAYNAYSILKTGRDEYGDFLPITNRSFDDYKPPMYMYLNIPTVAVFGLTPFAARLPSALFGFLTVPLIYFLTKKLFKDEKTALLAMFFMAISPWHLQFSRVGFEATVGLFFAVGAAVALLYGLTDKKWLIISSILVAFSTYTYHTQRIFVPLLFFSALIIFRKEIFRIPKKLLLFCATITVVIALPLVILIPPKVILQRFEVTTGRPKLEDIEKSIKFIQQDRDEGLTFANVIHNRRFVIAQTYFGNYLSHFDFNFLFTKGDDNFRHHIQDMGMLYLFELPLFLFGIFLLVKKSNKESLFLLAWLLIAPLAATPATPNPHANRALPMVVALEVITALALVSIFSAKLFLKKHLLIVYSIWITGSFLVYIHNYWFHYPVEKASFWQYGYKEAVAESEKHKERFEKIIVDKSIEQAYAFWLFNLKYDPKAFQENGSRYGFDKYVFDSENPPENSNELFVSEAKDFPGGFTIVRTVYYPDGTEAIKIGYRDF
jgi:4-amino-4-deoxy-L-arabinose transferase-like glycosyltransferase